MVGIVNSASAFAYIDKYFDTVQKLGYVKKSIPNRLLAYSFIVNFVDTLYYFLTEEDYNNIEDAMLNIFSGASCLLPYNDFCTQKIKLGKPYGKVVFRGTEGTIRNLRSTEDVNLRKV